MTNGTSNVNNDLSVVDNCRTLIVSDELPVNSFQGLIIERRTEISTPFYTNDDLA